VIALMIGHFFGGEVISARAIAGSALVLVSTVALLKGRSRSAALPPLTAQRSSLKSQEFIKLET
jgi:drug/metabolite transporter (DMT)-like permease